MSSLLPSRSSFETTLTLFSIKFMLAYMTTLISRHMPYGHITFPPLVRLKPHPRMSLRCNLRHSQG